MKILKKTKFQNGNTLVKKYKFCGLSVLRKEKSPTKKKWIFLGIKVGKKNKHQPSISVQYENNELIQYGKWVEELKNDKSHFVAITDKPYVRQENDIKIFAYYLPQFHAIQINDENYGKGFTEWTNVASCMPQYVGHYQPKIPYDVGFYDLNNITIMARQAELAKMYGIYGFCFYYYWFNGTKVLDMPLKNFLSSDIDLPFHFCWANENWSKLWDGGEKEVILYQEKKLDANLFFEDILPYIKDKRYEKIENKPLLMIYRPNLYEKSEMLKFTKELNQLAINSGFDGFFFMSSNYVSFHEPLQYGLQGITEFPPHELLTEIQPLEKKYISPSVNLYTVSLNNYIYNQKYNKKEDYIQFKCCFPSWDNSPRKAFSGGWNFEITAKDFYTWLAGILNWTKSNNPAHLQYVYINAWNEWAEGAILEPTTRYGYQKLQIVKDCLETIRSNG